LAISFTFVGMLLGIARSAAAYAHQQKRMSQVWSGASTAINGLPAAAPGQPFTSNRTHPTADSVQITSECPGRQGQGKDGSITVDRERHRDPRLE
jgi:hypothetical protein